MQLAVDAEVLTDSSTARDVSRTLQSVIDDLDRLNHETEQYFLTIGGHLSGFIDTVKVISSGLTTLMTQISKTSGQETSQAFTAALGRSKVMQERAEGSGSILGSLSQEAGRVRQILAGFKQTITTFRMLGILTRIEGARLGDASADFSGLASMAAEVRIRVEKTLASASLLIPAIENALQNVSALEKGQAKDLPLVISRVLTSLATFGDMQRKSHKIALRMVAQYGAISQAFTKLIVSMQFHDITRQQVEHVIELLQRLLIEVGEQPGIADNRLPIASIVSLQSSQLADAADSFRRSVTSIALSLDGIATHTTQMADQSALLFGISGEAKNPVFLEMEQGCNAILASLGSCVKAEDATRQISDRLSQTISGMRVPVEKIRAIAIQMQRVGMNARIRAANTGSVGDALGALSRSIQQLALETQERAKSLLDVLDSMKDSTSRLSNGGKDATAGAASSQDSYLEGMRIAVAELHSNERGFAQLAQIVACGNRLRDDLLEHRKSFSVGAIFAEAISRARGRLAEIASTSSLQLSDHRQGVDQGLVDFAKHYTLQSERDVHQSVTQGIDNAPHVAGLTKQPKQHEPVEPEGDVEFF